jgi:hypothetical protein
LHGGHQKHGSYDEKSMHFENDRPIFGMLTQPMGEHINGENLDGKSSYLPVSHVKYIESSGARVIPIDYNIAENELILIL